MTFGAVLDANVLVPVALADTLLGAAEAGLYRPLWSGRILDALSRAGAPGFALSMRSPTG